MASPDGLQRQLDELTAAAAAVNQQMKQFKPTSPEWQRLNRECADIKVRRTQIFHALETTGIGRSPPRDTTNSQVFQRMLELVEVHRSSKAYITYKKIKAQLLREYPPDLFEKEKMRIQQYLKQLNHGEIVGRSESGSGSASNLSQVSVLGRNGSRDTASFRNMHADAEPEPNADARDRTSNGPESVDDFIDDLALLAKVPLDRALEIIGMDLGLNHEEILTPQGALRAVDALLAHRLNEQIDILISCGVAQDEVHAKHVLDPLAAAHAEQVHSELRTRFNRTRGTGGSGGCDSTAGASTGSATTGETGSTTSLQSSSSSSLLSGSPSESPTGSYRNNNFNHNSNATHGTNAGALFGSPQSKQYRHSSPAINSSATSHAVGAGSMSSTRPVDVNAHTSALAAMQVARLRASSGRNLAASTGRINLPDNFAKQVMVGDTLNAVPNE